MPRLLDLGRLTSHRIAPALEAFKGHPIAKAALEMAVLDAELRTSAMSLGTIWGGP